MSQISIASLVSRADVSTRYGVEPVSRRPVEVSRPRGTDQVEVSAAARAAAEDDHSPVRLDVVRRIREQIASGTYETPDKIAVASHEMARALRGEA